MRVCVSAFLVTTKPGMQLAGVGRHMFSVLDQLTKKDYGHRFDVFLRDDVDMPDQWKECAWITWHKIPIQSSRQRVWWEHVKIGQVARQMKADVLLSMFVPLPFACSVPMVAIAHDAFPRTHPEWYPKRKRIILDQLTAMACKKSNVLVTVSQYSRAELARAYGVPESKIVVAPNGLGNSVRSLTAEELIVADSSKFVGQDYIFSVSTLEPRKNMNGLIRAFEILKSSGEYPHLELCIAGAKGWLDSPIAEMVEASPVKDFIKFPGYVSDLELNALMQNARVFVCASHVEGFGIPPLEAMTIGTPVVASNTSSLPEVCGDCVEYCDPSNPSSIAEAMQKVISDSRHAQEMRACGLERSKLFSWEESVNRLVSALETAVN